VAFVHLTAKQFRVLVFTLFLAVRLNCRKNIFFMKSIIVKAVSLVCITILIFACNGNKEPIAAAVVDKEQIKKEIQAKEDSFANLYNTGELRDIGYYADDATSFFQNRKPLVGKEAIVNFLKNDILSNTDRISFVTKEVFVSNDGNQVVEIGAFKVVDSASNPLNSGNYMSLFEKRNGKYVAVRDMSASDMPIK
jgi:ketosteroid isomerase-like protein